MRMRNRLLTAAYIFGMALGAGPLPAASQAVAGGSGAVDRAAAADPLSGEGGTVTYFIARGEPGSAFRENDRDLALWALGAWERSTNGVLHFEPAPERSALLRIYWVAAGGGEYGETRPLVIGGRHGAAVYIRPDTEGLGRDIAEQARKDPLFRDTVVYLTCLHEIGHAIGLEHTADDHDIMFFFGFGGDIPGFFGRYRQQLHAREDIANVSGLSDGDLAQLRGLYPAAAAGAR